MKSSYENSPAKPHSVNVSPPDPLVRFVKWRGNEKQAAKDPSTDPEQNALLRLLGGGGGEEEAAAGPLEESPRSVLTHFPDAEEEREAVLWLRSRFRALLTMSVGAEDASTKDKRGGRDE